MIQEFVEDALHCVTKIEQAMDSQDLTQLQDAAQDSKGLPGTWGLTP